MVKQTKETKEIEMVIETATRQGVIYFRIKRKSRNLQWWNPVDNIEFLKKVCRMASGGHEYYGEIK